MLKMEKFCTSVQGAGAQVGDGHIFGGYINISLSSVFFGISICKRERFSIC